MLKLNSSDSELEFTPNKKAAPPPNLGRNKKKGKSKAKSKSKNQGESNQGLQEPSSTVTITSTTTDSPVKVEGTDKPSTRHQMGSSFENNTEKLGMLSSSSTSEEEGDSSDEEFMGRRAIGIDPAELENFDGTSAPVNGSQYLMMVMNERGNTPKVAVSSVAKNKIKKGLKLSANYVEKFKEECADDNLEAKEFMSSFSPTTEWRDTNVREFSLLRCKVERWRELLLKRVTRLKADSIKLPEIGNKVVWLKFCFGMKFEELIESRKGGVSNLSVLKIVEDYFTDFKQHTSRPGSIITTLPSPPAPESASTNETPLSPRSITTSDATSSSSPEKLPTSEEHVNNDGCQPLMSLMLVLTQPQIENLIYFQADWITRFGFANKCQGEWLYALLACIDKPVDPSTMGDVRNICKSLVSLRSQYCTKLTQAGILCEGDNDEIDKLSDDLKEVSLEEQNWGELDSQASEYLNALNLFIYLIGDYFCQKDLVEGL